MKTLSEEQINEIAQELDIGMRCYVHRQTDELVSFPDTSRFDMADTEAWEEAMEKLDENRDDYLEIEPMTSTDAFEVMEDFTHRLEDSNSLKSRLIRALERRKPFREFKNEIDDSGEYRQQWFDFKNKRMIDWVKEKFDQASLDEEY